MTDNLKNKFLPYLGLIFPFILFASIFIGVYLAPWFSWTNNYISDLAGLEGQNPIFYARGIPSVILNLGLTISGTIGLIFSIFLIKSKILEKCFCKLGSMFLIFTMVSLILVGVLPKTTGIPHYFFSWTLFLFLALFLIFIGFKLRKTDEKKLGLIALILGIITLITFPLFPIPQPYGNNAIVEMIGLLSLCFFMFIFSLRLLHNKPL